MMLNNLISVNNQKIEKYKLTGECCEHNKLKLKTPLEFRVD